MITGLFETHLKVADLERSMHFYGEVLDLELAHRDETRPIAFYWLGTRGDAMLGLWLEPPKRIQRQHFAFRSTVQDVLRAPAWLRERGLTPRNFLNDGTDDPMVFAWMPALALYFTDPDGHSLELIAMLEEQPRPELGVVSREKWESLS
ncbi:Glyoxalase/bleomycin resistance protein/dioxygenase [Deinococcus proteolyticus MRP]|uniref:Glyoxalase/bleomycin resistance protein/dioxygenase n=1 Tax=Deinococcus proteolyticus (strain ATCC 35074 / DSM 20540 / JCM 6276 / NBRC 101906 / NCIMB 13154 / VKM Ac-1939 / CCM 2703 / MRP) TaxID=693977 RepID=F0RN64_DEIPM|nr:VOC family protein [Deinococcus proteolyticus]ADY26206.1 Glyoxalase/bleomycin resistance protein/dioxygenase [Deinococcus proteolyticus MRP]